MLKKIILAAAIPLSSLCVQAAESPTEVRCVLSGKAELFLAPDDRALPWPVPRYTPFRHIDTRADWHLVEDFEGDRFWVHNQYVTDSHFLICGVLTSMVNAYSGPGLEYDLVGNLPALTGLRVVEYDSGWIRGIASDEQEVWVPEEAVRTF